MRITYPIGGTLTQNRARPYVNAASTDIRRTFAMVTAQIEPKKIEHKGESNGCVRKAQ